MSVHEISFGLSDARLLLEQLRIAARSDGASPKSFALLLRRVFEKRAWEEEGFATFRAYVKAEEPYGLGMTEEKLLDAARLASVEPLAKSLLDEETPRAQEHGVNQHTGVRGTNSSLPSSDIRARTVARLKRDDPELAEKVVRGEVTPNAAALEKGWRSPRVVLSSPERIAEALRRHMSRESLLRLAELLTKEN